LAKTCITSLFISGTDTMVGKTVASAALLMHAAKTYAQICYIKPIQTGCDKDSDTDTITALTQGHENISSSCGLAFKKPLSPHLAAHYEGCHISLPSVLKNTREQMTGDFNIVEGAGGLMVPINNRHFMIDLIAQLSLPCVLVTRSTLGTINHTLLSIEALRTRGIPIWGVIMMGEYSRDNEASVAYYGRIKNIISLPWLSPLHHESLERMVEANKHKLDTFLGLKQ
jgi:dethiobiotin synthetase